MILHLLLVNDRNLYFGLGQIPKPKPKMTDTLTSRNQFFYTSISKKLAFNSKRALTHSKSYNTQLLPDVARWQDWSIFTILN